MNKVETVTAECPQFLKANKVRPQNTTGTYFQGRGFCYL